MAAPIPNKHYNMADVYAAVLTYESGLLQYADFSTCSKPVWILGRKYDIPKDFEELQKDVRTCIWLTYRRQFSPIGGMGPTSDAGWGCMLRCGQMVLANTLLRRHLGKFWRWDPTNSQHADYLRILRLFQDKKNCSYSIHQIAQMGVSEGKQVGEWFGPNTVAHVLRKLVGYDSFTDVALHVAMDNTVIIDECRRAFARRRSGLSSIVDDGLWIPLLLFIPLRLGLAEINSIYFKPLKAQLCMPNTMGIIGGRPNHALYFIGACDDELVFLDPHTTQNAVDLEAGEDGIVDDSSYHTLNVGRIHVSAVDPSVALCFYFHTSEEFDAWCTSASELLVDSDGLSLFEVTQHRPLHWPDPIEEDRFDSNGPPSSEFTEIAPRNYDTDEEFELL